MSKTLERLFLPLRLLRPLDITGVCSTLARGSSVEKSRSRLTKGCDDARYGVVAEFRACDVGPIDDCLRGEEFNAVLIGERPIGGGKIVLLVRLRRRTERTSAGSSPEAARTGIGLVTAPSECTEQKIVMMCA